MINKTLLTTLAIGSLFILSGCNLSDTSSNPNSVNALVNPESKPQNFPAQIKMDFTFENSDTSYLNKNRYITFRVAGSRFTYYEAIPVVKHSDGYQVLDGTHDNYDVTNISQLGYMGLLPFNSLHTSVPIQFSDSDSFNSFINPSMGGIDWSQVEKVWTSKG